MEQPTIRIKSCNLERRELYERHGFIMVRGNPQFLWLQRGLMWEEPFGLDLD
jgi:hypothetical protein